MGKYQPKSCPGGGEVEKVNNEKGKVSWSNRRKAKGEHKCKMGWGGEGTRWARSRVDANILSIDYVKRACGEGGLAFCSPCRPKFCSISGIRFA